MTAPTDLKDTRSARFSPAGTSDSLDETDQFPGACSALQNLVPDLNTQNMWVPRPAATVAIDFSTWPLSTNPGHVSVAIVVGDLVCGYCHDGTTGLDKPFVYNMLSSAFVGITITGGATFPSSSAPLNQDLPTAALIGTNVVMTHPLLGTQAANISLAVPAVPVYNTADLTGAITFGALGKGPSWVCQFGQRAYYGVNTVAVVPSVVASDVLTPFHVTSAGQALTFGNNLRLTAAAPLGLSNQLGGIIQSLMVFQGNSNIQQITGDFALTSWDVNTLNVATGTLSPRSICSTPQGLAFLSPSGLRIIDQGGNVGDPIGIAGSGVNVPFLPANIGIYYQLACAGCDGVTLKIALSTLSSGVEYWYNIPRKVWSGPHGPFASAQFMIYNAGFLSVPNPFFLIAGNVNIYATPTDPQASSSFVENGGQIAPVMTTVLLDDNGQLAESELAELQVITASPNTASIVVNINSSSGSLINTATTSINPSGGTPGVHPYRVDFPKPTVFNRMKISVTLIPYFGTRIGDLWLRLRTLGFIVNN